MSGRVKATLPSGRRVTGYRKTERVIETRRRPHEMPDWRLSFMAPPELFLTSSVIHGVVGVAITDPGPRVEIRGKRREWLFDQLGAFLLRIQAPPFKVQATLERMDKDVAPTGERPYKATRELIYTPTPHVVFMHPLKSAIMVPASVKQTPP